MFGKTLFVLFLSVALAACSSGTPGDAPGASSSIDLSTLPVTLDGLLVVDVAEGDVDEDDYSEINFGTLTVGDDAIQVQVTGSVLRSAGVPPEGGLVKATLSSRSDEYGITYYQVSSLQSQ